MAIYHFHAQVISRKSGRSSTAAAAYRAGEKIADDRTGEIFDFTRKGGVDSAEILTPDGAPSWALDRSRLWNQVEGVEIRKDAQLCREIDVAIPRELADDQRRELVRGFVRDHFVSQGMIADVAFHDFDSENPHAHVMLTMRDVGPEGFGKKNRDWNDRALLAAWREGWAEAANAALESAQVDAKIDHRSYEAQGLDRLPTAHLGPAAAEMERRSPGSSRVGLSNWEIECSNDEWEREDFEIELDEIRLENLDIRLMAGAVEIHRTQAAIRRAVEKAKAAVRSVFGLPKQTEAPEKPAGGLVEAPAPILPPANRTKEARKPDRPDVSLVHAKLNAILGPESPQKRPKPKPGSTLEETEKAPVEPPRGGLQAESEDLQTFDLDDLDDFDHEDEHQGPRLG